MALWKISPNESNRSVTEIQTWKKFDHCLVREEIFDWAEFTVNADAEPTVNLINENGYLVNHDTEYSWSLSQLTQTKPDPTVRWIYPSSMTQEQLEILQTVIDTGGYLALDANGWELDNTDFWLYGLLVIEPVSEEQ